MFRGSSAFRVPCSWAPILRAPPRLPNLPNRAALPRGSCSGPGRRWGARGRPGPEVGAGRGAGGAAIGPRGRAAVPRHRAGGVSAQPGVAVGAEGREGAEGGRPGPVPPPIQKGSVSVDTAPCPSASPSPHCRWPLFPDGSSRVFLCFSFSFFLFSFPVDAIKYLREKKKIATPLLPPPSPPPRSPAWQKCSIIARRPYFRAFLGGGGGRRWGENGGDVGPSCGPARWIIFAAGAPEPLFSVAFGRDTSSRPRRSLA